MPRQEICCTTKRSLKAIQWLFSIIHKTWIFQKVSASCFRHWKQNSSYFPPMFRFNDTHPSPADNNHMTRTDKQSTYVVLCSTGTIYLSLGIVRPLNGAEICWRQQRTQGIYGICKGFCDWSVICVSGFVARSIAASTITLIAAMFINISVYILINV